MKDYEFSLCIEGAKSEEEAKRRAKEHLEIALETDEDFDAEITVQEAKSQFKAGQLKD